MANILHNVLSVEDIEYLLNLPEVELAKAKLNQSASFSAVYFNIALTETIRASLLNNLGLDLSNITEIPMRWIKGDIMPHVDVGSTNFENTYLAYINDSQGEFVINDTTYPISENTAFVFNEGLSHMTRNTGDVPRLLLGPMNEFANPVGASLAYFDNQTDALSYSNPISFSYNYTIGVDLTNPVPYSSWRLSSNSSGTSSQSVVYQNGDTLNNDGSYTLYPALTCFLEGTEILSLVENKEVYVPIEKLRCGDLVKTSLNGYKKIELISKDNMVNPGTDDRIENRLYVCRKEKYPELLNDLYMTGCHSILVDHITDEQRMNLIKQLGKIYVTDRKYRLTASVDERSEPWNSDGNYCVWHLALENENKAMNYGIYANGLLVESCSIHVLKNRTNMSCLEY